MLPLKSIKLNNQQRQHDQIKKQGQKAINNRIIVLNFFCNHSI